jgi:hypothetical protein
MKSALYSIAISLAVGLVTVLLVSAAFAQPDPCNIPPGTCRTQTQGGWGATCHGGNPGCLRDANFNAVFPSGLTVGGNFTILFVTSASIDTFLPAGGTPSVLTGNHVDPSSTEAGVFAGQVVSLAISLAFSNAGVPTFCTDLGSLVVPTGVHSPSGPFAGWSVNQIFALANQVLGGNTAALPAGISVSNLNDVVDAINNNFDDGTHSDGYLVEPGCDEILPVELSSFTAVGGVNTVDLTWITASERGITGYDLARQSDGEWATISHVAGLGDNATGHTYAYRDASVAAGTVYTYRLTAHEVDGSAHPLGMPVTATPHAETSPNTYALSQNYPNPFNPSTSIAFDLAQTGFASLKVYNDLGEQVASLVSDNIAAGHHIVNFDASNLSSGVYIYRLNVNGFVAEHKMLLMK